MKKVTYSFVPLWLIAILFFFTQCKTDSHPTANHSFTIKELPLDIGPSGMPNLFVDKNNRAFFSWLSFGLDSIDRLQYAALSDNNWSTPRTIAEGKDWFANWADFPSLISLDKNGEKMAAHYLQYSGKGTYDYDIKLRLSTNGGSSWSSAIKPHQDTVQAEHGFVSLLPLDDRSFFASWLDGRFTKIVQGSNDTTSAHDHGGPMTLRSAVINLNQSISEAIELDSRVCDCCQTDAAMGLEGPIIVYRDRSLDEIRDIYIVRKLKTGWTLPMPVHMDNWKIAGCPVNGPALAVDQENIVVAWFTMAANKPQVKVAISKDNGFTFDKVIPIDLGAAIGRVDLTFTYDKKGVLISWLEQEAEMAAIYIRRIDLDGKKYTAQRLFSVAGNRSSGFPRLESIGRQYLMAYVHELEKDGAAATVVKTAILQND